MDRFDQCGLVTRFSPSKLDPQCFQDIRNAVLDNDSTILRRNGYAPYNATACTGGQAVRGLWAFNATDGSKYIVMFSSASMFYSKGDGTCTAITGLNGGLSTTATMSCVQTLGYLWCADGTDTPFRTNVTSTDVVSGAPSGALYVGAFRNRVVMSGATSNLTSIYLSGELNGMDWTLPTVSYSTSPAILKINGINDGLGVTCLMGEYQNSFLIGRNLDLWGLYGNDLRDFVIRQISNQVGCMDNRSTQEVNNVKYWLSRRGVEAYTGTQINRASFNIDPTLNTIIAAAGNSQAQVFTTQADFQGGNLTVSGAGAPMSATISPGDVVPSSWSVVETATATWISGTSVNVSTNGNVLALIQGSSASFTNMGAESQNTTTNWASVSTHFSTTSHLPAYGSYQFTADQFASTTTGVCSYSGSQREYVVLSVCDSNGNILISSVSVPTADGVFSYSLNTSTFTAQNIFVAFQAEGFGSISPTCFNGGITGATAMKSVPFIRGTSISPTIRLESNSSAACGVPPATGNCCVFLDFNETNKVTSGTYTTQRYDTSFSTPTWGDLSVLMSSATTSPITFQTRVSATSGGTLDVPVTVTNGQKIGSAQKEFILSVSSFSVNSTTNTAPSISSMGLAAETTGYYISPCVTAAGNTSWGNLGVNGVTNGGSFTFSMSTSAVSCAQVIDPINANWTTVTANSIIPITVSSYTAVRVLFGLDVATQVPTLNDITVNWNSGTSRPPVTSVNYKNEYWLFYTSSTAVGSYNDHALVLDENSKWILHDDINAASAAIYLNTIYTGDSKASGTVFQQDTGGSDNGGNFTESFTTPDLDGGDPISLKNFKRAYLVLGAPTDTTNGASLSCNYALSGSTNTYSLGTVNFNEAPEGRAGGYFVSKLQFPTGSPTLGQWVNLTCSNTGSVGPLRVYGIRIVYAKNDWP